MTKSKEEIEKLRMAADMADDCFGYICYAIKVGMTEKEVAAMVEDFMLSNGATALAFDTIVGSGENSAKIHSTPTDRKIEYGDIVLLDFGCVLEGYCSDLSRTIFMGEVKEEYKEIYNTVLASQLAGIEKITDNMSAKEADAICRDVIKEKGYDFDHALGHGIGTVVHEAPVISQKSEDVMLENDMVFTIEPGIYLEGKFGVRIEDAVLLEDGKIESLSHANKGFVVIPVND